jgi:hypothetical protein
MPTTYVDTSASQEFSVFSPRSARDPPTGTHPPDFPPKFSDSLVNRPLWVNNLVGFGPRKEPVAEIVRKSGASASLFEGGTVDAWVASGHQQPMPVTTGGGLHLPDRGQAADVHRRCRAGCPISLSIDASDKLFGGAEQRGGDHVGDPCRIAAVVQPVPTSRRWHLPIACRPMCPTS